MRLELELGGEVRAFAVGYGWARKVQDKCGAGPAAIAQRLAAMAVKRPEHMSPFQWIAAGGLGTAMVDDVREPIFQGLIAGGLTPNEAGKVVRDWVDERPFAEPAPVALELLLGFLLGPQDDPAGELQGAPAAAPEAPSPPKRSASRKSTARAPRSASPRAKSTS